jgi:energy-coupling factor transport system permease protein
MDTGQGFGYRALASPPHAARAWITALWAGALLLAALLVWEPLVLGFLALSLMLAMAGAGAASRLPSRLRMLAWLALPIVAVNVLVSRQGLTVFARLGDLGPFGQGDLTVQALVYGAVFALKVAIIILVTTLASLAIDPDELLRALRRLSFRSALTASLAVRMVPLLSADARRLAEAQLTRPEPRRGVRARALLVGAVVAGSLDRAMDVAATLEVRGFAQPARPRAHTRAHAHAHAHAHARGHAFSQDPTRTRLSRVARRVRPPANSVRAPLSRHDLGFLASALALVVLVVGAKLAGLDRFRAYPLVHDPISAGTWLLCSALAVALLLPFCDRRGIR